MIVPISQDKFLSNRYNKKKLIGMLIEKFESVNITTKQARDDADVLIIETAIEESKHERTAIIIGEDIDLLVILIGRTQLHQEDIFFKKVGKGNAKTQIYSLKSFEKAYFDELAQVFLQENCHVQQLYENRIRILLAIYNAPKSEDNIDHLRYTQFIKSTKLHKPVQLSNLPPTSAAAHQHINRVYYQGQK